MARAGELNRRWLKRQQSVWDAIYAMQLRGLDTERWHSKVESLDACIARALEQHSLLSVLDAIANAWPCAEYSARGSTDRARVGGWRRFLADYRTSHPGTPWARRSTSATPCAREAQRGEGAVVRPTMLGHLRGLDPQRTHVLRYAQPCHRLLHSVHGEHRKQYRIYPRNHHQGWKQYYL